MRKRLLKVESTARFPRQAFLFAFQKCKQPHKHANRCESDCSKWKAQRAFHAIAHRITFNVIRTTLNNKGKLNARKLGYNCSKLV